MNNSVVVCKIENAYESEEDIILAVGKLIHTWLKKEYGNENIKNLVASGNKVVIKPNLVNDENLRIYDPNCSYSKEELLECLITNISVIKGVLKVLEHIENLSVSIIEAPIQFCNIDKVFGNKILNELQEEFPKLDIKFIDLRRTILDKESGLVKIDLRDKDSFIDFDLELNSQHELCTSYISKYRVTDYPPYEMKKYHNKGHHIYRVAKEIIEADIVFNIPKLKTHMKAGMTGATKNFIGVVGNKECLPHHTKGGRLKKGDCYGDLSIIKLLREEILDIANSYMHRNASRYKRYSTLAEYIRRVGSLVGCDEDVSGSWHGNNTLWKTIIDVNRIVYYGNIDGEILSTPQRKILSLVDAVVAGENCGPMKPTPRKLGRLFLGDSTIAVDKVCAMYMGFDYQKIKYLSIFDNKYLPLIEDNEVIVFDETGELIDFKNEKIDCFNAPERWKGYIENDRFISELEKFNYKKARMENLKNFYFKRGN